MRPAPGGRPAPGERAAPGLGAYDGAADAWEAGATLVYEPLAAALVASCPRPLDGLRVLDVGSGTGAVAKAAAAAGAHVIAADASWSMLAVQRGASWPLAVGDLGALPVRDRCVDAAAAGFVLNHLPPEPALREMARAVRPGGIVFASTWDAHGVDPVKAVIDHRLRSLGWVPPAWYRRMKEEVDPISGDPERLAQAARRAGLVDVGVAARVVDVGLREPAAVVAYRLATPHIAPWVAGLAPADQHRLRGDLAGEVAAEVPGWRPAVLFAHGWVRGQSRSLEAARSRVGA